MAKVKEAEQHSRQSVESICQWLYIPLQLVICLCVWMYHW